MFAPCVRRSLHNISPLKFHPPNDVVEFSLPRIVPPGSMPIKIPKASGFFADNNHAEAYRREFLVDGNHNGFGIDRGFHAYKVNPQ